VHAVPLVGLSALCTPGMGVNLWGVTLLYVNPVSENTTGTSQLPLGKSVNRPVRTRMPPWCVGGGEKPSATRFSELLLITLV
jgi:hypothetical protein